MCASLRMKPCAMTKETILTSVQNSRSGVPMTMIPNQVVAPKRKLKERSLVLATKQVLTID